MIDEVLRQKIIVALDVPGITLAEQIVKELSPYVGCFKIGLELQSAIGGPQAIAIVHSHRGQVFYDGKFDDIPNTIAGASRAIANMQVKMFNVHASSGIEAMKAAVSNKGSSLVLAVTVLTSLDDEMSRKIFGASAKDMVVDFALDAQEAGCDGIICSPSDLMILQDEPLEKLLKVVPGVRPKWAASNDQKRFTAPAEAILAGADYLVIGRPITNPPKEIGTPINAVEAILNEIEGVL